MKLADIRDYIASLELSDIVYMGRLDDKKERSIGVYHSRHRKAYKVAIGGTHLSSYGTKYVTLLVHWNKSPVDTEQAASAVFEALISAREVEINDKTIKFIQPLYEPQDIGCDAAGIYEMVLELAVIYAK